MNQIMNTQVTSTLDILKKKKSIFKKIKDAEIQEKTICTKDKDEKR